MENYILPDYIIDSISFGDISKNIMRALARPEFLENNPLYKKYIDIFTIYAKAYMVYAICTNISVNVKDDTFYKGNSIYYNYVRFNSDEEMVAAEVDTLVDIFNSASQTDDLVSAITLKSILDFNNLKKNEKTDRYKELSKYDTMLYAAINKLSKQVVFKTNAANIVGLCKCYLVSKEDLSDEEYICGSGNFLENVVSDAYSVFEQSNVSYSDRIESRNSDLNKIRTLKRIIDENRLD